MATVGTVTTALSATSVTAGYQAKPNDLVLADATGGAFSVTLPVAPLPNSMVVVKKTDASSSVVTVVLPASSTSNIDGDTSVALYTRGSAATLEYDGTAWRMLSTAMVALPSQQSGLGAAYPPWTAGRTFYAPPQADQMLATSNLDANTLYLWPIRIPNACKLVSIGTPVGAAATINWYLGLYADNPTVASKGPTTLLWSGTGSTTVAAQVQTALSYTFSAAATVWIALLSNATIYLWYNQRTATNIAIADPTTSNIGCCWKNTNYTYAAGLPADLSAVTTSTALSFPHPYFTFTCG